jgi:tetratricopeptide (TPR) repeat protein
MLWRWLQNWRERRAGLAELRQFQRADEAILMDQNQNPLNLAKLAVSTGNLEAAAMHWERACSELPGAVLRSEDSFDILLALNRLDEAERLMRKRRARIRGDEFALIALAEIAEMRGDVQEALSRWEDAKKRVMGSTRGYLGCARHFLRQGQLDAAENELRHAAPRDPTDFGLLAELARISDQRGDWERSVREWTHLAARHELPQYYASAASAMIELGRSEEAEAYVSDAVLRFPASADLAIVYADLAQRRGDFTTACERWATVRAKSPLFGKAYHDGAQCLVRVERHAEAEAILSAAIERFPQEAWPSRSYALLAHDGGDWREAALRWGMLRERHPDDEMGYSMGMIALRAAGREQEAEALRRST